MRSNRVTFQPKPAAQDVVRTFDFTSWLEEGETLAGASVEISVYSGAETFPTLQVDLEDLNVDGAIVEAPFSGGELGTVYTVTCFAGTCNGQLFSLAAYLAVSNEARQ